MLATCRDGLLGLAMVLLAALCGGPVAAATPDVTASASCKALEGVDFSQIQDVPTQVIESKGVGPTDAAPGFCHVRGYVTPNVGFVLRMPDNRHWNGKFIELGCGGFCGSADALVPDCDDPLRRGYACLVSDNGHRSSASDAKWAYNNLQAEVDHAYRAAHASALAGKAIVERYYSQTPRKSYFMGCSTGGRQAMMEAQRFPWDFDGIVAGAPSLDVPAIYMHLLWANRAIVDTSGRPVLEQSDLEILHQAVVAKCDLNDGVRDGLIGDPRACRFDTSELLCTAGKTHGCLGARQVEAVKRLYSGPVTSRGVAIYMPGPLPGSERTWLESFRGSADRPFSVYNFAADAFRYSAFQPNPGPAWKPEDFDFDRDYKRLGVAEGLYAAVNPDLRAFKAAGGKLLSYTGWNDALGMALPVVDYYETAERVMGGRESTQAFFRLFVIPGMNHCTMGDGAFAVDWLSYLDAWVDQGNAPDELLSSHVNLDGLRFDNPADVPEVRQRLRFPLDPATVEFSRPVYPYPVAARYQGRGNPKEAASFGPAQPRVTRASQF